jgi:hypothetical protein
MKAYITCPITHSNDKIGLLNSIKSVVEESGIDASIFEDAFTYRVGDDVPADKIFNSDYNQLKSNDIIIAEVSEGSHGVGAEIGMSFCLGLKRILLIEEGKILTKLLEGMPETIIIRYIDEDDLVEKLKREVKLIMGKNNL